MALVVTVAVSGVARADVRSTVAVVRTPPSDRLLREATMRLRAELSDAGFDVVEVDRAPGDSRSGVEDVEGGPGFATVSMNRTGTGAQADIWISDHVTGKTVVRRLEVGGAPNAAAVLAIRALELLRASLLEVASADAASAPPMAAPPDVMKWVTPALPERPVDASELFQRTAIGVGALAMHGLRGIGLAAGPALHVSHGIARGGGGAWFGRVSAAAPLAGPVVQAAAGTASVTQGFGALDLGWAMDPDPVGVFAWIGAGVSDLHTVGSAALPYHATSGTVVSFLATAGVGGALRLGSRLALTLDAAAVFLVPRPVVVIGGQDAGSEGLPSIAGSLGLLVGL
jgi:hypothetical protein